MDRQEQIEILLDHYESPRRRYALDPSDVLMPGGNPGCGDVITIYIRVSEDGNHFEDFSFEGEGCTISQAASSILMELIEEEEWSLDDVVNTDYNLMMDILGKEAVQMRPKCATLALGTMKAAIKKYRRDVLKAEHGIEDDVAGEDETLGIITGDEAEKAARQ